MSYALDERVLPEDLKKFEKQYYDQIQRGHVLPKTQFEYSWCLIRSEHTADIKKGVELLKELGKASSEKSEYRDYLYYLGVGYARLGDVDLSVKYINALLKVEPNNKQALELKKEVDQRAMMDAAKVTAAVGGAVVVGVGLVGLGIAALKKFR